MTASSFGERLAERVTDRRSQLVLGLDPDPARLWPAAAPPGDAAPSAAQAAADAVLAHCRSVIEAVAEQCVAVKLQVACFERLGAPGWSALGAVAQVAREHELLVIADAKRGDIDVTARAYGHAYFAGAETPFGTIPGLGADALTVNALLGEDSVAPLLDAARATGSGLFLLVRTSNPGAALIQDRVLEDGGTVADALAALVCALGASGTGPSGIADVGAVVGATVPEHLARLRDAMPAAPLLLPGVGAQGGSVSALAPAFAPGPAGGLIAVSRGLVHALRGRRRTRRRRPRRGSTAARARLVALRRDLMVAVIAQGGLQATIRRGWRRYDRGRDGAGTDRDARFRAHRPRGSGGDGLRPGPRPAASQPGEYPYPQHDRVNGRSVTTHHHRRTPKFYVVRPGDTLSAISISTHISIFRLTQLNPGLSPNCAADRSAAAPGDGEPPGDRPGSGWPGTLNYDAGPRSARRARVGPGPGHARAASAHRPGRRAPTCPPRANSSTQSALATSSPWPARPN